MRIDAHQHFWRYAAGDFPWIGAPMQALARDFLPAELQPQMQAQGFDRGIAVQARPLSEETDWLLALAADVPWIAGIVGWVDLQAVSVREQLSHGRSRGPLVGVRAMVQDAPDPSALLTEAAFERGVAAVQDEGLVYDLLVTSRQLDAALDFCRRHDRHWIVLDHLGKPDIEDAEWAGWRERLQALAALPHVACKLSGLVTQAPWGEWTIHQLLRYGRAALEDFGSARLMFGSDWPVCTLAATHREVTDVALAMLVGASGDEREAVFGGTAARCYGLPSAHTPGLRSVEAGWT